MQAQSDVNYKFILAYYFDKICFDSPINALTCRISSLYVLLDTFTTFGAPKVL